MEDNKNKKKAIIIGLSVFIIILLGSTYAFFSYTRTKAAFNLTSNGLSVTFTEGSNEINFSNAYPISDEFALSNLNNLTYVDFTVSRSDLTGEAVSYEIYLSEKNGNTLDSNYIKLYLTDELGNTIVNPISYDSLNNTTYSKDDGTGKVIYYDTLTGQFTKNYRLYVWLDKNYSQNTASQSFNFYVNLYAYNGSNYINSNLIKVAADARANDGSNCLTTVVEDEITYISGTKECINFNYVWWSGKMWRITAIYPDGSMKMVTDNNITSIAFNNGVTYYDKTNNTKSWIYEWLNEDFKDTLYNQGSGVIDSTKSWNATMPSETSITIKPVETDATMIPTTTSPVGLLNSYEYYKSYQNTTYSDGYLNINYCWWLLNPYDSSHVYYVSQTGDGEEHGSTYAFGVRPAVYLKSGVALYGNGTKSSPYMLSADYDTAKSNDLLNTRKSGEYIKFSGDNSAPKYRIVSVENNKTKIVAMDYANNKAIKKFASTVVFGDGANTQSNEYWDYYLNHEWYNNLSFKNKIVSSTYYIGAVGSNMGYKTAICQSATDTTSDCLADSNKRVSTTFTGNVGLLRFGEMFATQQWTGYTNSREIWLITKLDDSTLRTITVNGYTNGHTLAALYGVRPVVYLNSTVSVLSGNGTELNPYLVG